MFKLLSAGVAGLGAVALLTTSSAADGLADQVVRYTPGNVRSVDGEGNPTHADPSAALGGLDPDGGFALLTPFNPPFGPEHLVEVGRGGSLTLGLSQPALTSGHTLGIHAGVGLSDTDYPNGALGDTAYTFDTDPLFGGAPRKAIISVSDDGSDFVSLGEVEFLIPSNVDAAAPAAQTPYTGSLVDPADLYQPFTGDLQDFANQDFAGVLDVLDGSAGGTWLDLSGLDLAEVNYVRFEVPSDADWRLYVDAVVSVPEPSVLGVGVPLVLLALRRRRAL